MPRTRLQWFGSSGIRGPLGRVHADLALALGRALGARYPRVVVGRDARLTGNLLESALVAGLSASGAAVDRVGTLPTPALARAARAYDLGVQVTASHNPAPDNGFKLWTPTGSSPDDATLQAIETDMETLPPQRAWDQVGPVATRTFALDGYLSDVLAAVRRLVAKDRPLAGLRVALDCAHGAGALATPRLLTALGAQMTLLGGAPDGRFPDHPSEPDAAHLVRLSRAVADGSHAFGLAHDGDADRTVVLAPDGQVLANERVLAVVAALRGDRRLALPIDASGVVADHLADAEIQVTPVGDIHLSRAIESGATIACEPSGTWFFGDWSPTPEGPFAAAYLAALAAQHDDLFDRIHALPQYARSTQKVPLPPPTGRAAAHALAEQAGAALAAELDPRQTTDTDGVRLDTDDGWVLVRPSGTEPVLRITAEATRTERAEALAARARACLDQALAEVA